MCMLVRTSSNVLKHKFELGLRNFVIKKVLKGKRLDLRGVPF